MCYMFRKVYSNFCANLTYNMILLNNRTNAYSNELINQYKIIAHKLCRVSHVIVTRCDFYNFLQPCDTRVCVSNTSCLKICVDVCQSSQIVHDLFTAQTLSVQDKSSVSVSRDSSSSSPRRVSAPRETSFRNLSRVDRDRPDAWTHLSIDRFIADFTRKVPRRMTLDEILPSRHLHSALIR